MPEAKPPASYAAYSEEMLGRFQHAYTLVREHLREAAKRSKRYYDMTVRAKQYDAGDWVLYYNPRKRSGRQDKWVSKYSGPYLVTKVLGPVNVVIQQSKRSRSSVTDFDKLKTYTGDDMPDSWLSGGNSEDMETDPKERDSASVGENHAVSDAEERDERLDLEAEYERVEPEVSSPVDVSVSRGEGGVKSEIGGSGSPRWDTEAEIPFAIAGCPTSDPLPLRPRRTIRPPKRYTD